MNEEVPTKRLTAAIVIPSYGRPDLLERTLESIAAAVWPPGFTAIRVVENGPISDIKAVVEKYAARIPVEYHNEPELGLSAARNAGIAASDEDIILFFDNDVKLENDCLLAYRHAFDRYGVTSFYGGPVLPDYVTPPADWLRSFLPPSAAGFDLGKNNQSMEEPLFIGPNMAYPRRLLLESSGFDPIGATGKRGGVGEETRLQRRLLAQGNSGRYVGMGRVWHYVPENNCSPEWALGRAFRHGITQSLEARQQGRKAGIPRWIIRQVATAELKSLLARIRRQSLSKRFAVEWDRSFYRGLAAGCHDGKRHGEKTYTQKHKEL